MSMVSRRAVRDGSSVLLAVLLAVGIGVAAFLISFVLDQPPAFSILTAILVAGLALVTRLLVGFERRLARFERSERDSQADLARLVGDAFAEISEATELFHLIEASALRTDQVTQLVRNSTAISPDSPPIVYRFAQAKIGETSELVKLLADGGTATYYGEDRDWLLGLTRAAGESIDAISLSAVDHDLWQSEIGQRYLDAQRQAARAGRRVRRIFVVDDAAEEHDPALLRAYQEQRSLRIDVRLLDRSRLPARFRLRLRDLVLFDDAIAYETTPTPGDPAMAQVAETRLILAGSRVRESVLFFDELWELAREPELTESLPDLAVEIYLDTDDEAVATEVFRAVDNLAVVLGLRVPTEVERARGSIIRRARTSVDTHVTAAEVDERLSRVEKALDLAAHNGPQVGDGHEIDAVVALTNALAPVQHACVQLSRLLYVKFTADGGAAMVVVRHLFDADLRILEQRPDLLRNPQTIISELDRAIRRLQADD
jgi:uncharacterized protein DUF6879